MFSVVKLKPLDDSIAPSAIILHPLLKSYHLDDLSLPISFPVDAQAQLRLQDNRPVLYCQHRRCDASLNGVPANKHARRVHTGDVLKIASSDSSAPDSVTYAVQVAYFCFSPDLRTEVGIDMRRLELGAILARQADTTVQFPLSLPLDGKLPSPAPTGTNWVGVQDLVADVRDRSFREAVRRQDQHNLSARRSSSPVFHDSPSGPFPQSRTYAQLVHKTISSSPSAQQPACSASSPSPDPTPFSPDEYSSPPALDCSHSLATPLSPSSDRPLATSTAAHCDITPSGPVALSRLELMGLRLHWNGSARHGLPPVVRF
ncbi:hypothetical protein CF319_g7497 [Tilletia indica]|nr:hypothetical protein CF319_g7497 [Tilletia indica]